MSPSAGFILGGALACWCAPCLAVTVLGVPIGETLQLQGCPAKKETSKQMCWIGRPTVARDGTKVGKLHLPAQESMPAWAANQSFMVALGKDGTVEELKLPNVAARDRPAIVRSISGRFGTPRNAGDDGSTAWAGWAADGVHIKVACQDERCVFTVRTSAAEAAARLQADARKTSDAGKPGTP
jgi:hypothetical protein